MDKSDIRSSGALTAGAGSHPSYGIQEDSASMSTSETTQARRPHEDKTTAAASMLRSDSRGGGKERVWSVAWCCLTACVVSIVSGMMLGYSSATLVELEASTNPAQKVVANSTIGSLFGVSDMQVHQKHSR